MQLNSTIREMDQQHPPPEAATVHRYATPSSTRQGLNASQLIRLTSPLLPIRRSEARQSNAPPGLFSGRRDRTGLPSNTNRSNQNEYVEEPVSATDGKPVSSSSSSTPLTSNSITSESKSPPSKDGKSDRTESSSDHPCKESIFCPRCQRCRCIKCQQSRRLPTLRCGLQCLPEELVDCCSCLWCARAAYRRCSGDDEDGGRFLSYETEATTTTTDALCACSGRGCCRRWTILAALTPCLPCLCLYWPLRCLLSACSTCYNCRRRKGCRCTDARGTLGDGQGGALLISDELLSSNSSASV